MKGAGEVAPFVFVKAIHEEPVVEGVGVFIDEEEGVARCDEVGAGEVLAVGGVELVGEFAGIADE